MPMAILRAIRNAAFFPFFLLLAPFILLGVTIIVAIQLPYCTILHHQWRSKLRRQGRYRNRKMNLTETLGGGTLLVDSPTLGWNVKYCWWTPDDLRSLSPYVLPTDVDRENHIHAQTDKLQLDFDEWCFEKYLSVDTGSAILLATRKGDKFAEKLMQNAPDVACVYTWSAPCFDESTGPAASDAG